MQIIAAALTENQLYNEVYQQVTVVQVRADNGTPVLQAET